MGPMVCHATSGRSDSPIATTGSSFRPLVGLMTVEVDVLVPIIAHTAVAMLKVRTSWENLRSSTRVWFGSAELSLHATTGRLSLPFAIDGVAGATGLPGGAEALALALMPPAWPRPAPTGWVGTAGPTPSQPAPSQRAA